MKITFFLVRLQIKINLQLHDQNKFFLGDKNQLTLFFEHHVQNSFYCKFFDEVQQRTILSPKKLQSNSLNLLKSSNIYISNQKRFEGTHSTGLLAPARDPMIHSPSPSLFRRPIRTSLVAVSSTTTSRAFNGTPTTSSSS